MVDPSGKIAPLAIIPMVYGAIEIALSISDIVDWYGDMGDPCLSTGQKTLSTGLLALGMVLPGGGYGKADDLAEGIKYWAPHANVCAICGSGSSTMQ